MLRNHVRLVRFAVTVLMLCSALVHARAAASADTLVYVGTYTEHDSKGIYAYRFDSNTGHLSPVGLVAQTENPSYLAIDPRHRFLFAANEVEKYNGQETGAVSAFAIDAKTAKLSLLNEVSSRSPGPAYVTVDRSGRYILIANYSLGSIAVYSLATDGRLREPSAFIQHHGGSVNTERQAGPHAHAIELSPDNRFALVTDLGTDQVVTYSFDPSNGTLKQAHVNKLAGGSGPRHLRFSPNGRFVYVINEMLSTIAVFEYRAADGSLLERQSISTLPKEFHGKNDAAELYAHPSGRFLYASNRGHDSIAIFAIDKAKGTLAPIGFTPTGGKTPRNFALDPSGSWLLAANQDSDDIVVFRIDAKTGQLTRSGDVIRTPSPVCITFDSATDLHVH